MIRLTWHALTCHTKVDDDLEFQYYKKIKKILFEKIIGFYNFMSFATKWMKQHEFNNSIVTNWKYLF
jgi:hypothetical protein